MLVVGPNGVGKTNLLESLHVATQGFSPRTRQDAQLIRFGETAGRIAVDGTRDALRRRAQCHAPPGPGEGSAPERGAPAVGRVAAARGRDAGVHARPAGGRQGRPGSAARVLRPRARQALPGTRRHAAGLRRDTRAAQRGAATRALRARGGGVSSSRGRSASPRLPQRSSTNGARHSRRSHRPSRSAPTSSGCRLPGSATTRWRRPRRTSKRASHAISNEVRPGSGRISTTCSSRAASATCASTAHRASSGWRCSRCCWPRRSSCRRSPLLLLDDVLSELDLGRRRVLAERVAGMGQTMITATHASALPIEPAQLVEVEHGSAR